ncbi:MAG: hypothetical protein CL778_03300 [Chloroflexi bacterium]|nr:hypothetical protein [Chloroflexota bacterium]|tara:strand:- start:3783 stop:4658 length:876 start_codon:yes stop_codon:yes gene_type:complete
MTHLKIMVSRHSAFYSPLIATISGNFLDQYGISASYHIADKGNTIEEVGNGNMDIGQAAVSGSWSYLENIQKPPVTHFAQINSYDGFFILGRKELDFFSWNEITKGKFLFVHGGQPEAMLRYALSKKGIDLDRVDKIFSNGGEEMMKQWDDGIADFFHEQGAYPQQLEYENKGKILGSVGQVIGPVAFSSLICSWDWVRSDIYYKFIEAYAKAREWVNTAEPFEVAEIERDYFPNISIESISKAIEFYQKLGTWDKDIKIEPELYEKALDVFEFSNLIKSRYDYDDVVFNG